MAGSQLWNSFPELVVIIQKDHKRQQPLSFGGHDFGHALGVAQYAAMIAEDEKTGTLGWVAGLCHNTDRIFPGSSDEEIEKKIREYLNATSFEDREKSLIVEAVLEHPKKNDPNDNPVTIILKDADRLDNLGALVCLRSAQLYHNMPAVDYIHLFSDPNATFKNPGSVAKDIAHLLEWEPWLRLPKAKILAAPKFAFLKSFLQEIEHELREKGLYPYPFAPDEEL